MRTKSYDDDTRIHIYNEIRAYEMHPEDITDANIDDIVGFIEIKDVETLRREKAELQEQASRGNIAIMELQKMKRKQRLFSFPYEFAFPIVDRCKRSGIDVIFYLYLWNKDLPLRRIIRFCNDAIFFRILGMYPNAGRTIQPITNDRTDNKVSCEEHIRETT